MTQYNLEELRLLNQVLFALFIVADFALFLFFYNSPFPWFALLGSGIGLAIIVLCWSGRKYIIFIASLLVFSALHTLVYNWSSIVH
ncbi:hypothetical protein [uncultured Psychrobacillus sp.]|uniref:hypothetical protein n=1 Tax=uncultured Psychrobacillus sp. TaxID=1551585 RepID=UPI0026025D33|nr:hypothetical protein [uncultured Psychrobacillus sp.]